MTKSESTQLAVLVSQMEAVNNNLTDINKHFKELNSSVQDVIRAVETAKLVAKAADDKAVTACSEIKEYQKENDNKVNKLYLFAAFLVGAGILSGLGISSLIS